MVATTAPRTDIHRPSAPEFDPEAYECHGVFDLDPEWGDAGHRIRVINALLAQGFSFHGAPHGSGQCSHCGHWPLRYAALMLHRDTRTLLYVGETCLDNRFDGMTKGEFARLRAAAALNREQQSRRARFVELCDEHPDLAYASYAYNIGSTGAQDGVDGASSFAWEARVDYEISTLADIAGKALRYGAVSAGQLGFVAKLLDQLAVAEQRLAERNAAKRAALAAGVTLPTGRVVITGTIVKVATQDNPFTGGIRLVMTVRDDRGFLVWGTLPGALDADHCELDKLRSRRVSFTAGIEPGKSDPLFGFFKRPTKASYLD